jgi:hypothetical protein
MSDSIRMNASYVPSDDVVAREIDGEMILVPVRTGVGDMEDELYALQGTAMIVWNRLSRNTTVQALARELAKEFDASLPEVESDVAGLLAELLRRRLVVEYGPE